MDVDVHTHNTQSIGDRRCTLQEIEDIQCTYYRSHGTMIMLFQHPLSLGGHHQEVDREDCLVPH